jgi:hypothetical protein
LNANGKVDRKGAARDAGGEDGMTTAATDMANAASAASRRRPPLAPAKTPPASGTPAAPAPPGAPVRQIAGSWPRFETWPWLHGFVQTTRAARADRCLQRLHAITHVKTGTASR